MAEKFLNLSGLNTLWSKIKKLLPYWSTQKYLDIDCSSLTVENFLNKSDGLFSLIPWTTDVNSTSSGVGRVKNLSSEVANNFSIANFTMIRWWQARDFWEVEIVAKAINRRHRICYQSASSTVGVMYFLHNANSIISGTFPIERGGTGETTARGIVLNTIQRGLNVGNADLTDEAEIITTHANSGYTSETKDLYRRKVTYLWNYIQSKISSVLGLTKDSYGGEAASATSAGKLKSTNFYTTSSAKIYEILTYQESTTAWDIPSGGVLNFITRDSSNNNHKGRILYSHSGLKILIESWKSLTHNVRFYSYIDSDNIVHVYCSLATYASCSFVLLNENTRVESQLLNTIVEALPEGAIEATYQYNVSVDSAKGSTSVPIYVDTKGDMQSCTDVATKTALSAEATARNEADKSLQESINSKANSSELSSKLNTSGSNASITTTNALLDKGDVISDYTKLSDNDYVITKSSNTNRTSLGALCAWIISKFESLTGRFLNLQVYQGENGALTNVATDYSLNLNYYTKSAVDTLLAKKANGTALNSLGTRVDDIEESLSQAGTRSPGRCLRPTCVFEANASASIDAIRQNYNTAIYPYDICIIINVSSSSITISGFQTSSGTESYSVPAYKCVMFTALGTNSMYVKTTDKT